MHKNYAAALYKKSASASGSGTRRLPRSLAALACIALLILPALLRAQSPSEEVAVRAVLAAQQTAWNAGDVEAFMSG
jgi:hypothetical protein